MPGTKKAPGKPIRVKKNVKNILLLLGVILNSYSCVATYTDMNFHSMFDRVVHGYVKEDNEGYHESSMVKQIIYYIIMFFSYLG